MTSDLCQPEPLNGSPFKEARFVWSQDYGLSEMSDTATIFVVVSDSPAHDDELVGKLKVWAVKNVFSSNAQLKPEEEVKTEADSLAEIAKRLVIADLNQQVELSTFIADLRGTVLDNLSEHCIAG